MPKSLYQLKLDYDTLTPEQEVEFLKAYVQDVGIDLGGARATEHSDLSRRHLFTNECTLPCSCRANERRRGGIR